ncbi:MAG: hypothetical protein H7X95_11190, partial [Deltaproteobacteria bacterium]|nr:hypothetical protein [Deltaproteobacteria bacterium]
MAKPPRSPLLGYNHNLTHLGRVFHIQTEDSGPVSPRLFTHLFFEGTILVSRRHEYDAGLADDKVRALMQAQHKTVMKDLLRARLDGVIIPFFAARGEELTPAAGAGEVAVEMVVEVEGAVPSAPLSGTPGPVMVVPDEVETAQEALARAAADEFMAVGHAYANVPDARAETGSAVRAAAPASPSGPRRTATRSFETTGQRVPASTPTPVVVRAADARRSPFVSSGTPAPARMSSTDGVVVHRNVVVGAGTSAGRPARIRPPVPYVVTGGGHTERPGKSASTSGGTQQAVAAAGTSKLSSTVSSTASSTGITASTLTPVSASSLSGAESVPRAASAFGV